MLTRKPKLAMTSATPGKTMLINHFVINDAWYLVDLPGYGYAQRGKKAKDKLTQIILAIAYFFYFHASDDALLRYGSWLFWIFVLKEVLMLIGGIVLLTHDVTPRAAIMYGKVATVAYYVVMIALLLFSPGFGVFHNWFTLPSVAIVILVAIAAVLTLIAFGAYAPDLRQISQKADPSEKSNG